MFACIIHLLFYGRLNLRRALFSPTKSQLPCGSSRVIDLVQANRKQVPMTVQIV